MYTFVILISFECCLKMHCMEHELRIHGYGREEGCLHSIMEKCEGKRVCVTLTSRWEDSMNLEEMGRHEVDWNHLAKDVGKL